MSNSLPACPPQTPLRRPMHTGRGRGVQAGVLPTIAPAVRTSHTCRAERIKRAQEHNGRLVAKVWGNELQMTRRIALTSTHLVPLTSCVTP